MRPKRSDLWRVGVMGGAMFLSQLLYILGIEMSGVTVATCMQPAIPVRRRRALQADRLAPLPPLPRALAVVAAALVPPLPPSTACHLLAHLLPPAARCSRC